MEYSDFCISTEKPHISPIAVDAVYYVIANSHYHIRHARIPDSLVFVITLNGHGTIHLENEIIGTGSGDIVVFDASQSVFKYHSTDTSWNFWWFEFRCTDPDFFNIPFNQSHNVPLGNIELSLCEEALHNLKLKNQRTASFLTASLICLLSEKESVTQPHRNKTVIFRKADQYIRHNLSTVTVKSLAEHLNISDRTLLEIFQTLLGVRTVEYIQNMKMEIACQQLITSESAVQEIADYLGYADLSTFSKCFRKHFGVSPYKYRKEHEIALEGQILS